MRALVIALGFVMAGTAAAQPAMEPVVDTNPKSPAYATYWAVGATAAAVGLAAYSYTGKEWNSVRANLVFPAFFVLAAAPSIGHVYADEDTHAGIASTIRGTSLLTFLIARLVANDTDQSLACVQGEHCDNDHHLAREIEIGSAAVFVGSVLYDLYDAHRAAERTNRHRHWALNPTLVPSGAGMSLSGSF